MDIYEKQPTVTDDEIIRIKQWLKSKGYPQKGYLRIRDTASVSGYGTYDLRTMIPVTGIKDGYWVSFQVNKAVNVRRDYTSAEYDRYVYECIARTGSAPYLGSYGNAEISFRAKDEETAIRMATDYNQKSIWNIRRKREKKNPRYNYEHNPTEE